MGWGTNEPINQEHGLKSIDQARAWLVKSMALWLLLPTSSLRKDWAVVVQSLRCVWLFTTPWIAACEASLSYTISWSLLKLMSMLLVTPSNHLVLCYPLLHLPSIFPRIKVFSKELALHIRWSKDWSFSFSISPSNEHLGLISFRTDWLISLPSKGFSRVFSNTIVQKHQFFSAQPSLMSNSHIHTWLLEKP